MSCDATMFYIYRVQMSFYLHVSHKFDEGLAFAPLFVGFAQSRICHTGYVLMGAYNSLQSAQIHWYKYISEASFVAVFNAPTPTYWYGIFTQRVMGTQPMEMRPPYRVSSMVSNIYPR